MNEQDLQIPEMNRIEESCYLPSDYIEGSFKQLIKQINKGKIRGERK
jgi:hypothetical protein